MELIHFQENVLFFEGCAYYGRKTLGGWGFRADKWMKMPKIIELVYTVYCLPAFVFADAFFL